MEAGSSEAQFLHRKDPQLHLTKPVERATAQAKIAGEAVSQKPADKISRWLDVIEKTHMGHRDDPRVQDRIKSYYYREHVIRSENITDEYIKNTLLGNEAELMGYQRGQLQDEGIKTIVLGSLQEKIHSPLATYQVPDELRHQLESMIITDQQSRLGQWFDYLTSDEADHVSIEFRYWAFTEMLKMGDYDPVRMAYNKRTSDTVANFPELDQQALSLVFDEVTRKYSKQPSGLAFEDIQKAEMFKKLLEGESFSKLYAFMQEHVRSLKLPTERLVVTDGAWCEFSTDPARMSQIEEFLVTNGIASQEELEKLRGQYSGTQYIAKLVSRSLNSFQTKWCIAGEGYAANYLNNSNLTIYFSQDSSKKNSIPRACIVRNSQQGNITEVRGIVFSDSAQQHLDDYITPVVEGKLQTMEGGKEWVETMGDMKKLGDLHLKYLHKKPFSRDDLIFLYQLDHQIKSSGYGTDPRIAELRSQRDPNEDMLTVFDCEGETIEQKKRQIATSMDDLTKKMRDGVKIKAYVGPLVPGIFHRLTQANVEHIYTSFPEGKIRRQPVEIGGIDNKEPNYSLEAKLAQAGVQMTSYAQDMMRSRDFTTLPYAETVDTVRVKVQDLGLSGYPTTDQIYQRAQELGLELCPAEVGPNYRLQYADQPLGEWFYIGMKQISGSDGYPGVFLLGRYGGGLWSGGTWASPGDYWNPGSEFVFSLRKSESQKPQTLSSLLKSLTKR